jgi:thiamine pyrophosphate-dependent acetolactate synthase large subunit-like protein
MSQMGLETLLALQKLADKSYKRTNTSKEKETKAEESYKEVWDKVKKEQEEWDKTLNEYDLTKYKLGLVDSFWADSRRKTQDYLYSYYKRQQRSLNQQAINEVAQNIAWLNQLNNSGLLNGSIDTETAQATGKALTAALQAAVLTSIRNFQVNSFLGI